MQGSDDGSGHRHDHHHLDGGDDHGGHVHHDHGGHVHAPASFGQAFAIGISLNTALVLAEAIFGYIGNSTALLADAGHNLSDVLGLLVAWGASVASKQAPSGRFTYGFRGSAILAALANAIFLLVATGAIGWEAILRLRDPEPIAGTIATNIAQAASGTSEVASNIAKVSLGAVEDPHRPRCCNQLAHCRAKASSVRSPSSNSWLRFGLRDPGLSPKLGSFAGAHEPAPFQKMQMLLLRFNSAVLQFLSDQSTGSRDLAGRLA